MNISKQIKKLREEKGLTQKELAAKMGVTASWVGMYESGKRQPKAETIKRFADALNVFITDLTGSTAGPSFESDLERYAYRLGQKIAGAGAKTYGEYIENQYHVWLQYEDGTTLELTAADVDNLEVQLDRDAAHTLSGFRVGKPAVQLPDGATAPGYRPSPSAPDTDPTNE